MKVSAVLLNSQVAQGMLPLMFAVKSLAPEGLYKFHRSRVPGSL